jgi:hypothetical protein
MSRSLLAVAALCAPLLSGCVVAAVGITAVAVSQEFVDNAQVAYMREDHQVVWEQAKATLTRLSGSGTLELDEPTQAARCNVDGAQVTVVVEIHDVGQTKLAATARKWGFYDEEAANAVITEIKHDLDR